MISFVSLAAAALPLVHVASASLAVALPLYSWPLPGVWDPVYETIASYPDTTFNIIVNPNSGPGTWPLNPDYITGVAKLNSYNNTNVYGYIHTEYGSVSVSSLTSQVAIYDKWDAYTAADIALDGIFVDESPSDMSHLSYMEEIYNAIRATLPSGKAKVWTNPGTIVDKAFYAYADTVNAYEDTYSQWVNPTREHIPTALHSKSSVMIIDYSGSTATISAQVATLLTRNLHSAFMFGSSGYSSATSLVWNQFASELGIKQAA